MFECVKPLRLWFHRRILFRDAQPTIGLGESHATYDPGAVPLVGGWPLGRKQIPLACTSGETNMLSKRLWTRHSLVCQTAR
jgi:hypothetical protein